MKICTSVLFCENASKEDFPAEKIFHRINPDQNLIKILYIYWMDITYIPMGKTSHQNKV